MKRDMNLKLNKSQRENGETTKIVSCIECKHWFHHVRSVSDLSCDVAQLVKQRLVIKKVAG